MTEGLILLALAWTGYFALHSLLASLGCKQWVERRWPALGGRYRLWYNALAAILLVVPLGLTWALQGPLLWHWSGTGKWVAWAVTLVGLAGFVAATRYYDMAAFMGLRGGAGGAEDGSQPLRISPLHRVVRHPWYFFGLLILWSRPMDAAWLVSALCITAYAAVGSHLEDRKLVVLYGDAYRRYRRQVPGLIPLPWRWLDRRSAAALETMAAPLNRSAHR
jgi:methanethiol S-methyltransferase